MSDTQSHSSKQNWLLGISLDRPVVVMLSLYIIAWIIRESVLNFNNYISRYALVLDRC
jgi:hypothetical protein